MPSINLDERLNLDTKVDVTLAEKKYSLVLNDELSVKISDVQLELSKRIEDLTEIPEEKFKEMSLEERKKLVVDTMHDGREDASAQKEFHQYFPEPGWVEHDMDKDNVLQLQERSYWILRFSC